MIEFKRYISGNGIRVIAHEDRSTPLVTLNIVYNAGSRFEDPGMTGLAHLMEHLMFSGSTNVPDFETPLQLAGGENNAFTNNDIADYYITIPAENFETALWVESDRMMGPAISREALEVQKKVVIEEFSQRYLNQPYGDAMHLLRPASYLVHPYRWPTIGIEPLHIEKIGMDDVNRFFNDRYSTEGTIITVAGNIHPDKAMDLVEKWFGGIPRRAAKSPGFSQEPAQDKARIIEVEREVPADMIYKSWHVCARNDKDFRVLDLLTDILAGGESGRLNEILVREKKLFSEINAYVTGDLDPGLIFCYGKLMNGADIRNAEDELNKVIDIFSVESPPLNEMAKVKNRFESTFEMANLNILNKALSLSGCELTGGAELIDKEVTDYKNVSPGEVTEAAKKYLEPDNCTTLFYRSSRH